MSFFTQMREYTTDDWRTFFITGAVVVAVFIVIFVSSKRRKNR